VVEIFPEGGWLISWSAHDDLLERRYYYW